MTGPTGLSLRVPSWPEPVERVSAAMRAAGVSGRLEEFPGGTPTAEEAARRVGCELGAIVKSLLFDCDGLAVLALVPGDRRADARRVAAAAGSEKARVASPERVEEATGFPPGAVAPFATVGVDRVLIDRSLLARDVVWVGGGSPRHMAALAPADLVRLAGAIPADVTETPS